MSGISTGVGLAIAGGMSAAGGIASGMMQSSAMGAQAGALQTQEQIAMAEWNRYTKEFAPLENEMVTQAEQPVGMQPGYLAAKGQLNKQYADLGANTDRRLNAMYPSGSGLTEGIKSAQGRAQIEDTAGLNSAWNQQRFNQMLNASSVGRGLPAQAQSGLSSAASGYGQQAGTYGNLMNQSMQGFGSGLNSLMMYNLLSGASGGSANSLQPGGNLMYSPSGTGSTGSEYTTGSDYWSPY